MHWRYALAAAGLVLVGFVAVDQLRTTISVGRRSGLLARTVSTQVWRLAMRTGLARSRLFRSLGGTGVLVLVLTLGGWYVLLWLGWSMVFLSGDPGLVVSSAQAPPATVPETIYFAGYCIGTLGNGDYSPVGTGYQLAVDAATLTGMVFITLGVTYLSPVVSAVVGRRSFASDVMALGGHGVQVAGLLSSSDIVQNRQVLHDLEQQLSTLVQQHHAYPVLHSFSSLQRETAAPVAVAVLLDAVILLETLPDPPRALARRALSSVSDYVEVSPSRPGARASGPPPVPDRDQLREHGLDLDEAAVRNAFGEHADLRREVLEHLQSHNWAWPAGDREPARQR